MQLDKDYSKISRDIEAMSGVTIGRRTLSDLHFGDDVSLRLDQIEALHRYFQRLGFPFLCHPTLASTLSGIDELHILIPAYRDSYDPHRRLCSPWDVLAAERVRESAALATFSGHTALHQLANDRKFSLPRGESTARTSRICLGSPRATVAFNVFCERLIDFPGTEPGNKLELPVKFYWRDPELEGPFVVKTEQIPRTVRRSAKFRRARAALIFTDGFPNLFEISNLDDPSVREFPSYAIVLARWLEDGSILACIAGLTGPATEAAARLFLGLEFSVPAPRVSAMKRSTSPLALYVIESTIEVGEPGTDDDLRVLKDDSIKLIYRKYLRP